MSVSLVDGTTGHMARGVSDCFCAAIATVLQIPPAELPILDLERGMDVLPPEVVNTIALGVLENALRRHGVRLVEHARPPISAARWIGVVPVAGWFASHSLVMARDRVLFDPVSPSTPAQAVHYVASRTLAGGLWRAEDVRHGFTLESIPENAR